MRSVTQKPMTCNLRELVPIKIGLPDWPQWAKNLIHYKAIPCYSHMSLFFHCAERIPLWMPPPSLPVSFADGRLHVSDLWPQAKINTGGQGPPAPTPPKLPEWPVHWSVSIMNLRSDWGGVRQLSIPIIGEMARREYIDLLEAGACFHSLAWIGHSDPNLLQPRALVDQRVVWPQTYNMAPSFHIKAQGVFTKCPETCFDSCLQIQGDLPSMREVACTLEVARS